MQREGEVAEKGRERGTRAFYEPRERGGGERWGVRGTLPMEQLSSPLNRARKEGSMSCPYPAISRACSP